MTTKIKLESSAVKQLAKILNDTGLSEIEYEDQGCRIRVVKHTEPTPFITAPAPTAFAHPVPQAATHIEHPATTPEPFKDHGHTVRAPMVGTAYLAPEPSSPTFVKAGDSVREGDTLLIIEAMKVMNPIKAPKSGIIQSILIRDSSPVEFDEPLIVIA